MATYVQMLTSWMWDLGLNDHLPATDEIYQRILDCAEKKSLSSLKITSTLWSERHMPDRRAEVSNLSSDNTCISLGDVGLSLCRGLVENLNEMIPKEFLHLYVVQRIVGASSALIRNQVLQKQVEQVFGLPLVMSNNSEGSVGAAMVAIFKCT